MTSTGNTADQDHGSIPSARPADQRRNPDVLPLKKRQQTSPVFARDPGSSPSALGVLPLNVPTFAKSTKGSQRGQGLLTNLRSRRRSRPPGCSPSCCCRHARFRRGGRPAGHRRPATLPSASLPSRRRRASSTPGMAASARHAQPVRRRRYAQRSQALGGHARVGRPSEPRMTRPGHTASAFCRAAQMAPPPVWRVPTTPGRRPGSAAPTRPSAR